MKKLSVNSDPIDKTLRFWGKIYVTASTITKMIGLAGQIGSGKTTVARNIAALRNGVALTISDTVRQQARVLGLDQDRRSLQDLCWKIISTDPETFASDILGDQRPQLVVIDGIRQLSVWYALRHFAETGGARLVFVAVPWNERVRRVRIRDGISEAQLQQIDAHPIERGWSELKRAADVVVDGRLNPKELAQEVLRGIYLS
jgi:dephospho-CoA kinase